MKRKVNNLSDQNTYSWFTSCWSRDNQQMRRLWNNLFTLSSIFYKSASASIKEEVTVSEIVF